MMGLSAVTGEIISDLFIFFMHFSMFSKSSITNMHYFHKLSEKVTLYKRKKIQVIREIWSVETYEIEMINRNKGKF